MGVKITIEFEGVDQAIVALGKLAGVPVKAAKPAAAATGTAGSVQPQPASVAAPAAPAPTPEKPARKPRADKGQPRGPHQPQPAPIVVLTTAPAAGEPVAIVTPAPVIAAVPAPVAATPPTAEVAQATLEKLFNEKGMESAQAVMSRFGVKRLRELPETLRAEFVELANKVLAGGQP